MSFTIKSTPETAKFWEGAEQSKLTIQRCTDCSAHYFPPAPICPKCSSRSVAWVEPSGRATLYSYTIANTPWPYWPTGGKAMSVALVELEEGVRLISTIVGCEQTPTELEIDMPLQATWTRCGDKGPNLLCFKKADQGSAT